MMAEDKKTPPKQTNSALAKIPTDALVATQGPSLEPAIEELRRILIRALDTSESRRAYVKAFDDLAEMMRSSGRMLSRDLLMDYRRAMLDRGLDAGTVNLRLAGIRRMLREAKANGYASSEEVERILEGVANVKKRGQRTGRWLTPEQARALLAVPDPATMRGKRDRVILWVLLTCALRREELASLRIENIEQRDGRWVFVDLRGKGNKLRTVAIPAHTREVIREWTEAAGITTGPLLRRLSKSGRLLEEGYSGMAIWKVVGRAARAIGLEHLAPHDLRRTCARLCRKNGAGLEQVQKLLGHESILTTQIYLGADSFEVAINDNLGL